MTKSNKLVEYGLEDEAKILLEGGYSTYEVADMLNKKLADKGKSVSHMVVQRLKEKWKKDDIQEMSDRGENVGAKILDDFRSGIQDTIDRSNKGLREAENLIKDAKSQDASISDKSKAIDTYLKAINQAQRGWTALVQNGVRQMRIAGDVNIKKEQDIKILLIDWSKKILDEKLLCPECKNKMRKEILKFIEEEEK